MKALETLKVEKQMDETMKPVLRGLASALAFLVALVGGIVVHENTHSLQGYVLGNGWNTPVYYPWTAELAPNEVAPPPMPDELVGNPLAAPWPTADAPACWTSYGTDKLHPAIGCTEIGPGGHESFATGEGLAYVVQAIWSLSALLIGLSTIPKPAPVVGTTLTAPTQHPTRLERLRARGLV